MPKKVLVAYASFSGSTAETAEFIGKKLSEKKMEADVLPVDKVKSLEGYDAVIIGSGVIMGKMKASAVNFAKKQMNAMSKIPVAFFLVCLTMQNDTPESRKTASGYIDPVRPYIKPFSEGFFPGRVEFNKIPFPMRLITLLPAFKKSVQEGDWRDWKKVEKWIDGVTSKLLITND